MLTQHTKINVMQHIGRIKVGERHKIVSVDKVFDKIQHPFMIKTLKLGIEVNFLNLIKGCL